MSDEKEEAAQSDDRLIPIETIEASAEVGDGPFMPRALADDPIASDGSASREGVEVSSWRLHTLGEDRLMSVSEPAGHDRKSRKARRAHRASRHARTEQGRTSRGRVRVVVGLLLAALVAGVAYAGISYVYEQWGGKTIPAVVGLSQANATKELEAKGLVVTTETTPSDTMDGRVVEVSPAQGERVDEGSTVHLVIGVSRTIPEVVGLTREEARSALEAAGAQNIRFETQVIVEEEDKVLEVRPVAGSVFMSSEEVTVVVSQLPRMLDVVGEEADIALSHLDREGISVQVQQERGTAEQRLHVIRTSPEAGQTVGGDGAVVYVGDPLIQALRIEDYFDTSAPHALEFLQAEGYAPKLAYRTQDGHLKARFQNDAGVLVCFEEEPWARGVETDQSGYAQVLDDSAQIEGVRLTIPVVSGQEGENSAATAAVEGIGSPTAGESTASDVMALCGFSGILGSCTQTTITLPRGTTANGRVFYCCYGESAQNVWTVLVEGESASGRLQATRIVATSAPKSTYAAIDLTNHGNSICDYVAYQELYQ